jgi:hypothetical protein
MLFTKTDSYTNAYTFNKIISGVANDVSVAQTSSQKCENNKMERYIDNGKHRLNYNVFNFSGSATASHALIGNVFDCNCHDIWLGGENYYNFFGQGSYNIILGKSSSRNLIYSTIMLHCGENFSHNVVYYGDAITCGDGCTSNIFGEYCRNIKFGSRCSFNNIGADCRFISFGVGNDTIDYCQYINIENGCKYINLTSSDTSASVSNYLQNIHVCLGIMGSSTVNRLEITVADRNLAYETTYKSANSTEIIL